MKRLLSLLLSASLLLTLIACSVPLPDDTPANPDDLSTPVTDQDPVDPEPDATDPPADDGSAEPPPGDEEAPPAPGEEGEPQEPEEYIRTVDPYAPMVALTFDDGPHELYSTQILDILEQYHSVATFFEVGYNARLYPEILVRMAELGCEIASHSNAHHDLTTLSKNAMLTDLAKLDQIIYDATGIMPTLVRPPYGAVNSTVKYETGRAMITWTVDTQDWRYRDGQALIDYLQNYGDLDGEIVLMHSIHASTAEAMEVVIPWLIEEGYQLVTVSELMAYYYGELLEANKFYNQTWFARHERTEYPLELPAEPMQTLIPEYTTVPVVPTPPPVDTPEQPTDPETPPEDDTTPPETGESTPGEETPPEEGESSPPEGGDTPPPESGETPPPEGGESPPPESGESLPPESGETPPPESEESPPPEGGEAPPPEGGEAPPPEGGETPPPESGESPPPEGGEAPPPENDENNIPE